MQQTIGSAPVVVSRRGVRWCVTCCAIYRSDFARCPLDGGELVIALTDPMIGKTIAGHYVIESLLGEGAMGRVYRAHHKRLVHKSYALKLMVGDLAARSEMRARFQREAQAVSKLAHPNVVGVADFGTTSKGLMYLVMELVEGGTLAAAIRGGALPVSRAVRFARQLCEGLAHAHERGVIHRDLKPDNVLVVGEGDDAVARLADFGLAISGGAQDQRLTTSGVVCTPAYAAPEQVLGHAIDHRVDLYALGATLHEMLTGRVPVGDTVEGLPPRLAAIVQHLLAHDPAKRPQSAAEVVRMLDELEAPRRLGRRLVMAASLVVAAAIGAGIGFAAGDQPASAAAIAIDQDEPVGVGASVSVAEQTAPAANLVTPRTTQPETELVRAKPQVVQAHRAEPKSPPPPAAPVAAEPRVLDLDVEGSLPPSVVRRAIDRALPALHRCGSGTAQVAFTIDEMQRATAIRVIGDRRTCISVALASVRTELAPDVGDAQVLAKLAF